MGDLLKGRVVAGGANRSLFAEPRRKGKSARLLERARGERLFDRATQPERLALLRELICNEDWRRVNPEIAGAFLRNAYDQEPYFGYRLGNYLTALARGCQAPIDDDDISSVVYAWGGRMMGFAERKAFRSLPERFVVYRGGVGEPSMVARGLSWTTKLEVALFFAKAWPSRWGIQGSAVVLKRTVERREVAALFLARREEEAVLPWAYEDDIDQLLATGALSAVSPAS